jgi:Bacterial regulatory protein, arsR family
MYSQRATAAGGLERSNSRKIMNQKQQVYISNGVGIAKDEHKLVASLIATIEKTGCKRNLVVASELDCFQGIADVVVGTANGHRLLSNLKKSELLRLSFSTSKILYALADRRKSSIEEILRISGLSRATVLKELSFLKKLGILQTKSGGRVSISNAICPPFNQIEAYEVKVKDWRSGIYQARNYKSFAHKVSVALPLARAKRLTGKLHEFRRMRVGLLGIGPTGQLTWFLRPRRLRPISGPRNFLAAVRLLGNQKNTSRVAIRSKAS